MTDDAESIDLDLLAASLRADSSDLDAFVESLAVKLEDAIPKGVRVERRRRGMFGPKLVRRVEVDLGDQRLELSSATGSVETRRAKLSGGIVLKSERLDIDAWLAALGEALAAEATRSSTTRQALQRLLI
ncbi:MAG: hypothetical protein QOJ25_1623 [Solirubrobacteraceae bacterium]|jgi:hypothetical protein|nr:hypothetical protein [Solirubrobacteraceae bacterium]